MNRYSLLLTACLLSIGCLTPLVSPGQEMSFTPFLELRHQYEDNIFLIPTKEGSKAGLAINLLAGSNLKLRLNEKTWLRMRFELAPRKFIRFRQKDRQDFLLSSLLRRRIGERLSLMGIENLSLRLQPNDDAGDYFKQEFAAQTHMRWTDLLSSRFGFQFRHKSYPHSNSNNYVSAMVRGNLQYHLGIFSFLQTGYQIRSYRGVIDPRVLQAMSYQEVKGIRQTVGIKFESLLFKRILANWIYQIEFDAATRGLRLERTEVEEERVGSFEEEWEEEQIDLFEEEADFNYRAHRAAMALICRLLPNSAVSLYVQRDFKSYPDWLVAPINRRRYDELTFLKLVWKQRLSPKLSAKLGYLLARDNSNEPTQRYADNVYSIGLQFAF